MITTADMFYAGYLLNEGVEIMNIEKALNRKSDTYIIFHFSTGEAKQDKEIEQNYEQKKAQGNIRKYIASYIRIKDIVFRMKANGESHGRTEHKQHIIKDKNSQTA